MEEASMRAMQIIEWGKPLEAREYPDPEPKGEEVLLHVEAAGVCHSDVHIWDGHFDLGGGQQISLESRGVRLPFTMGHEIAGEVAALGPQASGVKVGDKVVNWDTRGETRDFDNPDRLFRRRRPGRAGTGRQFRPARWQPHGLQQSTAAADQQPEVQYPSSPQLPVFSSQHRECPVARLMWSRNILDDHFPDVVALAVQHCPCAVDGHPDYRLRRNEWRRWHHQLHWFHLHMQQCRTGLRQPARSCFEPSSRRGCGRSSMMLAASRSRRRCPLWTTDLT
jgi:hypothetical protein